MNITINRPEMLAVSRRMAAVAPPESPLEVLRGTLLEADADGGKLTITSTNMELSLVEKLACTASESGACVVDTRLLAGMLEKRQLSGNTEKWKRQLHCTGMAQNQLPQAGDPVPGRHC